MAVERELLEIEALIDTEPDAARTQLTTLLERLDASAPPSTRTASLCERLGLVETAVSIWRAHLDTAPADGDAALRLVDLYLDCGQYEEGLWVIERVREAGGSTEHMEALAQRLVSEPAGVEDAEDDEDRSEQSGRGPSTAPPSPEQPRESRPSGDEGMPTDADLVRFLGLFAGREDVHARQWADGAGKSGYSPAHEPLTPRVLRHHLTGDITVGVYPVRLDSTVTFCALDLDIRKREIERAQGDLERSRDLRHRVAAAALVAAQRVRDLGLPVVMEDSGYKGRHLWLFLDEPEAADVMHGFGNLLLAHVSTGLDPALHFEYFPKQGRLAGKGLGNLIKLPLGIHRRSGRRSRLLDERGRPIRQPFEVLRQVSRVGRANLHDALARLRRLELDTDIPRTPSSDDVSSEAERMDLLPAPPERLPVWTEADFDIDAEVSAVLRGCPVLARLRAEVDAHGRLSYEEQLVLSFTLGHLNRGWVAVNHLFSRCANVSLSHHLKGPLGGNPMSCPKVRKRIPHVTSRVDCSCVFVQSPNDYPSPVLHVTEAGISAPTGDESGRDDHLVTDVRRLAQLERRRLQLEREADVLRGRIGERLSELPTRMLELPGEGVVRLVDDGATSNLDWQPSADSSSSHTDEAPSPESTADPTGESKREA